jgi:hypothetical protein
MQIATGQLFSRPGQSPANRDDCAGDAQRAAGQFDLLIGKGLPAYESGNLYLTVVVNHLLKIGYDASRAFESVADTETDA